MCLQCIITCICEGCKEYVELTSVGYEWSARNIMFSQKNGVTKEKMTVQFVWESHNGRRTLSNKLDHHSLLGHTIQRFGTSRMTRIVNVIILLVMNILYRGLKNGKGQWNVHWPNLSWLGIIIVDHNNGCRKCTFKFEYDSQVSTLLMVSSNTYKLLFGVSQSYRLLL